MNRRSFLKLLCAAIAAPFVGKAKISDSLTKPIVENKWTKFEIQDETGTFQDITPFVTNVSTESAGGMIVPEEYIKAINTLQDRQSIVCELGFRKIFVSDELMFDILADEDAFRRYVNQEMAIAIDKAFDDIIINGI